MHYDTNKIMKQNRPKLRKKRLKTEIKKSKMKLDIIGIAKYFFFQIPYLFPRHFFSIVTLHAMRV